MSNYTINSVEGSREFDSKHGPLVSYKVNITGDDGFSGLAEITQKPATPAPTPAQQIEGTLDKSNPKFPPKLKKAQMGGGPPPRGKSKQDDAAIARAVAYKGAIEIVAALITHGTDRDPEADIERFFAHGLGLLEGAPIKPPVKPSLEERRPTQPHTPKSPNEHALAELREKYAAMVAADPSAEQAFKIQLTAFGITKPQEATDQQLEDLIAFCT